MQKASYTKTESQGTWRFDVTPAEGYFPRGKAIWFGIFSLFVLIFIPLWVFAIWKWKQEAKKDRFPVTITVTPDRIQRDDINIPTSDVHRLIIRNPLTEQEADLSIIATTALSAAAQHSNIRYAVNLAAVSWHLDADAGGQANVLAVGLDEVTAYGLMRDVGKIIGIQ